MRQTIRHGLKKQDGFTMIEMLLTLLISSLCAVLLTYLVRLVRLDIQKQYIVEDDTAIMQLQLVFAQAKEYEVFADYVLLNYHMDVVRLEMYQDTLVKRPGFEVVMQDIENIQFQQEGSCVKMYWEREETKNHAIIGCQ